MGLCYFAWLLTVTGGNGVVQLTYGDTVSLFARNLTNNLRSIFLLF